MPEAPKSALPTVLPPSLPAPVLPAKTPEPVVARDLPIVAAKETPSLTVPPIVHEKPALNPQPGSSAKPAVELPPPVTEKPVEPPKLLSPAPETKPEPVVAKSTPHPTLNPPPSLPSSHKPDAPPTKPDAAPQVPAAIPSLLVKSTALPSSKTRMLAKLPEPPRTESTKPAVFTKPVESAKITEPAKTAKPIEVKTTEGKATPPALPPPLPAIEKKKLPPTRAERASRRALVAGLIFYLLVLPATLAGLFFGAMYFGRDTRVEGQVIPPPGMVLSNEVWIVTDFRSLAAGLVDDFAKERAPLMQEVAERQDHVQRAQADIAAREGRIRLIQQQIDITKKQIEDVVKQSRDATQKIWDVDGAQIDDEYSSRFNALQRAIADRAKALKLNYQPDATFQSPEVWANAYRLALYQVPAGVDGAKEHQWLGDQMKAWRDFQKTLDDRKEQLRQKAAALKLEPAPKINDLNAKVDELQQRMDSAAAEEVPLKAEFVQAQADLLSGQDALASLDDKYIQQINVLPDREANKTRIPLMPNGRFTWVLDPNSFGVDEKTRHFWIFSRATRPDGRQYWAMHDFNIARNQPVVMMVEPGGFMSTKAILRPDLSPEEQEQ